MLSADIALGEEIYRKRMARGLTQDQLAAVMGVTKTTVSYWEGGVRGPGNLTRLVKLCRLLNISLDQTLGVGHGAKE